MKTLLFFSVLAALLLNISRQQVLESDNFCDKRHHYRSSSFVCCAKKKYNTALLGIFSKEGKKKVQECLKDDAISAADKIIKRSWLLYKCLVEKQLDGKELTQDSFEEFMLGPFDKDDVKGEIKKIIASIKSTLANQAGKRRRRSSRFKREDGDAGGDEGSTSTESTDTTTEGSADEESTTESQAATDEESTTEGSSEEETTTEGAAADEESTTEGSSDEESTTEGTAADEESTTEGTAADEESTTEGPAAGEESTTEGSTEEETTEGTVTEESTTVEETTTEATTESGPVTDAPIVWVEIPVYRYLSVFEYFKSFKHTLPEGFEDFVRWWDIYHVAEFEACNFLSGVNKTVIKSYATEQCLNWIQRTARGGECCDATPIPIPMFNNILTDIETVQNITKDKLMSLVGTYTWSNLSFSRNIYQCRRLAVAILQEQVAVEDLEAEMDRFALKNESNLRPDYNAIATKLIPEFYPESLKNRMLEEMLPPTTTTSKPGTPQDTPFYTSMDYEWDIQRVTNFESTEYQFANPKEWDLNTLDVNKTRYLMWNCEAYRIIAQRILYYELTPDC